MARVLFVFFVCLLPAAKACDCAATYGLVCASSCSSGLKPIMHPLCPCCSTCPKLEYEECGGPYYSKGQCNIVDGDIPKLYCSVWESYAKINENALLLNGTDIVGTCLRKVCIKVCSDLTPASGRVCGSDGIEYKSKCHMKQTNNCYIKSLDDKVKPVDKSNCPCFGVRCGGIGEQCIDGQCVCKGEEHCDDLYEPVCGSNGYLYQSKCHANAAICNAPPEAKFTITDGTCEERNKCRNECSSQGEICKFESGRFVGCACQSAEKCTSDVLLLCASNGHTYNSPCHMDGHACKIKQEITFEHDGPCISGPPSSSGFSSPTERIYG